MTGTTRRPLALADLAAIRSVSDPRISPDGRQVAFVVEEIDLAANQTREQIWLVELDEGGGPCLLTTGEDRETEPRWSPDGRMLAFVSNHGGTRQIWLRSLEGGEPRQITSHPAGAREPAWSPDGSHLAFVALGPDRAGDPFVAPERDDRKRLVRVREYRHKLDGVGFFGPLRGHVWVVAVDGGFARQVTDGPYDDQSPVWSPDGRRIAFVSDRSPGRDWHFGGGALHVVDLSTGQLRRLSLEDGRAAHPSWSSDGTRLAYPGAVQSEDASPGPIHLWVVDAEGGELRCLTADRDQSVGQRPGGYLASSPPVWTDGDSSLLYLAGDGPSTHLYRFAARERVALTGGRMVVQSFSVDRAGRRAALLVTDPVTPAEIRLWDTDRGSARAPSSPTASSSTLRPPSPGGAFSARGKGLEDGISLKSPLPRLKAPPGEGGEEGRQEGVGGEGAPVPLENLATPHASALNAAFLDSLVLSRPEDIRLTRPDGTEIEGWLLRPPVATTSKLPLILVVHGGPHNYFGDVFSFDHQLFAALGYAVLYLNPRGSGGRDERFARAVCGDWGGKDFEDLMAMLDHVIARGDPPIDEHRLGITGSSYGGFMTCQAITRTNRFAAAVAGACISNLVSFFGTSDIGASWGLAEFGGPPSERLDWYLERSPAMHADRVQTPLLLYHGEADLRCPIEQSEQMFTALRRLGKTVEFLRVPTESHGVLNGAPAHRIAARAAILEWFERFLG